MTTDEPMVRSDGTYPVVDRYDPNGYTESVPKDKREAFQHFVKRARWQHYW